MKKTANPFVSSLFHRNKRRSRIRLAVIAAGIIVSPAAQAITYTYTRTTANTAPGDLWLAGAGWAPGAPVSDADAILNFTGALASGINVFTDNNIVGEFLLNQMNFTGSGPGTGTTPRITVSGNTLKLVNSTTNATPIINFNTTGTFRAAATISNNLIFDTLLTVTGASSGTLSGSLTGSGGLTKNGAGQLIISGPASYLGITTVTAGALQANEGTGLAATFLALNGGALQSNGAASFTRNLGLSGGTNFQLNGGGFAANGGIFTVNIGGAGATQTFGSTVGTHIGTGLNFGSATANNLTLFQNSLDLAGTTRTITVASGTGGDSAEISGAIFTSSGAGVGLTKAGAGVLTLSGANTYDGVTTVSAGTLVITGSSTLTGGVVVNGGSLQAVDGVGLNVDNFLTLNAGGTIQGNGASSFTRTLGLSGTSKFLLNGGGFSANGGIFTVNLGGAGAEQTFGNTLGTDLGPTLNFGSATANASTVFQNALDLNGATRSISVSTGAGGDSANITGVIRTSTGTAGITKTGTGTLQLSAANTYDGLTTVSAGILNVANANALGTSSTGTVVELGASLGLFGGTTVADESVTINGIGLNSQGALRNAGGSNTWAGSVILGTAGGAGTANAARIGANSGTLNISGIIQNGVTDDVAIRNADAAGAVVFSGQNTYTGTTHIVVGPLSVSSLNSVFTNVGLGTVHSVSSNLGAPTTVADGTISITTTAAQGELIYTGTGETTDRVLNLAGTAVGSIVTHSGTGALKFTSGLTATGTGAKTLTLQGSTAGTGELSGAVINGSGTTAITKSGTGTWTLSGASTYAGRTIIANGILNVSSINSVATNVGLGTVASATSNMGAPITIANGTIGFGTTTSTGQLVYNGTGETTDRVINLGGTTGGAILTQSGSGLLKFTSAITVGVAGTKTFTLQGSTAGAGEMAGAIINGTGVVGVTKAGTGAWTLSGVNTYSGSTAVNGGSLTLKTGSLGATAVTVGNGTSGNATLNVAGNYTIAAGGSLAVRGGNSTTGQGILNLQDTTVNTLTIGGTGASTVGGAAGAASILNFDIGNIGTSDKIDFGAGTLAVGAGGAVINLNQLASTAFSPGTYNLMTYASATGIDGLSLGAVPTAGSGQVASFVLSNTSTATNVVVKLATLGATAYWTGNQSTSWNTVGGAGETNFTLNADGTGGFVLPGATTDVFFAANTGVPNAANNLTTLSQDFSVNSLNFTGAGTGAAGTAYTIGGLSTLTVGSGGINVDAGSANHTISSKVALASNQTWTSNGISTQNLTVSGSVSGAFNLTVAGGRTVILAGNNSYANTTINSGSTLQIGLTTAGSLGTGSVLNNGTLNFTRTDAVLVASNDIGGTGNVIKAGAGTVALGGNNSYSGTTNVTAGVLNLRSSNALGSTSAGTTLASGTGLQLQGGLIYDAETLTTVAVSSGATNPNFLSNLAGNNEWTGNITGSFSSSGNNFRITSTAGTSLLVSGNIAGTGAFANTGTSGTGLVFSGNGVITSSGIISGNMSVISTNSGVGANAIISGTANTFVGATRIQSGQIEVKSIGLQGVAGSLGMGGTTATSTIFFGQTTTAGTLRYSGAGADTTNRPVTFGNDGTGTIDASGGGLLKFQAGTGTFTAGTGAKIMALTGTGSGEFGYSISDGTSGTVAITKSGTGSWTLSGTNSYTGNTTVTGGELTIAGLNTSALVSVTTGTVKFGGDNLISNGTNFSLGINAVVQTGNFSDTLGTLAVTGNSSLDLTGTTNLAFADSSEVTPWTGTLSITGWSGLAIGGGVEQLIFGTDADGLTTNQVSRISFINPTGFGSGTYGAMILGTGEIVPVIPEPSVLLLGMLGAGGFAVRRRRQSIS